MKKDIDQTKYRKKFQEQLTALKLNVTYVQAKGDFLYQKTAEDEAEIEVLDLVGSYGANLLGHYNENIQDEIFHFLQQQNPIFAQASISTATQLLSEKLQELFGDYSVLFTNTGAETVEAAIKHAFLENGKTRYWAIKKAYHGKSLSTLPFSPQHNQAFGRPTAYIDFLDPFDKKTWKAALARVEEVSFVLLEPIQGEGGIFSMPKQFVDWLNEVSQQYDFPIIVDEIQTGLGRTGQLLASQQLGLRADYICLSKALGGGFCKIGALLVKRKRFVDDFSILHTSTFGDDGLSATVAKKVLEIIQAENIPSKCAQMGHYIKTALLKIKKDFPTVIKDIRGEGLMIGIEFCHQQQSPSNLLRILAKTPYFGYVIAGYFLNVHQVRIMPTLSNPLTLRCQPSAYIQSNDIQRFLLALREVCEIILKADAAHLLSFLVNKTSKEIGDYCCSHHFKHEKARASRKVAFLGHLISAKDLLLWDKSFENWTLEELQKLVGHCANMLDPLIFDQVNVRTPQGEMVHLSFIGLFLDSHHIEKAYRTRNFSWMVEKIQKAVALAEQEGCEVLGLGGFTSILTRNGKCLNSQKLRITTGNSLTVGMGLQAIYKGAELKNLDIKKSAVVIVGAGGNIANTYAELLATKVKKIYFLPRQIHNLQVQQLKKRLQAQHPLLELETTTQLEVLKKCDIVLTSSNASQPIIFPRHLSARTAVICDLAVPADVDASVSVVFPQLLLIKGGIIRLPVGNDFIIGGIPLEYGHIFACMGETLLMGLDEKRSFEGSIGAIGAQQVWESLALAERFGFHLGALKMEQSF